MSAATPWVPLSQRPEWSDVLPDAAPPEAGARPIVAIAYSERFLEVRAHPMTRP